MRTLYRTALGVFGLVVSGCEAVGVDHEVPELEVAEAWVEEPARGLVLEAPEESRWWSLLEDPLLESLVDRALVHGLEPRAALARVREARALRGVATGERWPAVNANGSYELREESANTPFGQFLTETDIHTLGLEASWELDLWGRVRRSVEAANADLGASVEDARSVAVAVAAETAAAYVDLRAFQARLAIALTNVELQEQTLGVVRARLESGLVGDRDYAQAATNVETTRSRVPTLEIGVRRAENRLAVLTGALPGSLRSELAEVRPIPEPPDLVHVGVPAELVRRRPDVQLAERRLAAEVARIGVAEGELLPRLQLAGTIGLSSDGSRRLFEGDSSFLGFGPSFDWNLFRAGGLRARVAAQEARAEAAHLAWESSVLLALEETENAMTSFIREQNRRDALSEAANQARRAVASARSQYTEGLADFQTVLDSERALADLEDQVAQSRAAITRNLVDLYRSLAGGFETNATGQGPDPKP